AVLTTVVSQAGLWAEAYLITGMVLDAIHGQAPSAGSASGHPVEGMKKGMVFSGTFMAIVYGLGLLGEVPAVRHLASLPSGGPPPVLAAVLLGALGALAFPLIKTIVESFDGSQAFFRRVGRSYRTPMLYLRGAVV